MSLSMRAYMVLLSMAFVLSGCAAVPPLTSSQSQSVQAGTGRIEEIKEVTKSQLMASMKERVKGSLVSATMGGLLGGYTRKKMEEGQERPGAVAGATSGRDTDPDAAQKVYIVSVAMDDGTKRDIEKEAIYGLQVGDRVHIDNTQITKM